jgi:hypothetical protein
MATTRSDLPIVSVVEFLSPEALDRLLLGQSGTKAGHPQERLGLVATTNREMAFLLRNCTSFNDMGASTASFIGLLSTMHEIAWHGLGAKGSPGTRDDCYRFGVGDFYSKRVGLVGEAAQAIDLRTGETLQPFGRPDGAYYNWLDLEFLRGVPVPAVVGNLLAQERGVTLPRTFKSGQDVQEIALHADLLGLMPIVFCEGGIFERETAARESLRIRMSPVDPDERLVEEAANTFKGVIASCIGLESGGALQFHRYDRELLPKMFPAQPDAQAPNDWVSTLVGPDGEFWPRLNEE